MGKRFIVEELFYQNRVSFFLCTKNLTGLTYGDYMVWTFSIYGIEIFALTIDDLTKKK